MFRTGKNYFPQVFLEECKYIVKENKMPKYVTGDLEISSGEENHDEENDGKKKILIKEIVLKNKSNIVIASFFERAVLRMLFLREQFLILSFCGSNF